MPKLKQIAKEEKMNRYKIYLKYLKAKRKYNCTYEEFLKLKLFKIPFTNIPTFLIEDNNASLIKVYNNETFFNNFLETKTFLETFHKLLNYDYLILNDLENFKTFIKDKQEIIANNKQIPVNKDDIEQQFNTLIKQHTKYITSSYNLCPELLQISEDISFIRFITFNCNIISAFSLITIIIPMTKVHQQIHL